ncbi:hypothetical protein Scep_021387 [Stephania cephalantha]|uniref:Uncharacterized protein n=1 Tax=Stephania cephalantha TaxID=152367 RepID=A0AAP0FAW8_9MAGN
MDVFLPHEEIKPSTWTPDIQGIFVLLRIKTDIDINKTHKNLKTQKACVLQNGVPERSPEQTPSLQSKLKQTNTA